MKIRSMTAFSFAAALGLMVGCAEEGPSSYAEEEGQMPEPSQSTQDPYATDESTSPDATSDVAQDTGATDTSGSMAQDTGELSDTQRTEFAAFDTNSDGMLSEREFDSEEARTQVNLKNMTFAQVDRDSSGTIDPEEFSQAKTEGDAASSETQGAALEERSPDE